MTNGSTTLSDLKRTLEADIRLTRRASQIVCPRCDKTTSPEYHDALLTMEGTDICDDPPYITINCVYCDAALHVIEHVRRTYEVTLAEDETEESEAEL